MSASNHDIVYYPVILKPGRVGFKAIVPDLKLSTEAATTADAIKSAETLICTKLQDKRPGQYPSPTTSTQYDQWYADQQKTGGTLDRFKVVVTAVDLTEYRQTHQSK